MRGLSLQFGLQIAACDALRTAANLLGSACGNERSALVAPFGTEVDEMVGTLDDVEIVLHDDDRMAAADEAVEGAEQLLDVVEVESRCGLIEDEERGRLFLLADEVGEFHALVLTAREGRGTLSQMDIVESHLVEGAQPVGNGLFAVAAEKLHCLAHGHVEHVGDILAMEAHIQHLRLEPRAVAALAGQDDVGHELHLDGNLAGTLAFVTSASVGIEGEVLGGIAPLLGERL